MTPEEKALHDDLKATYGEMFPYRDPERIRIDDATLALGVLLRREMAMKIDRLPPGNAMDIEGRVTARPRVRNKRGGE